MVVLSAAICSNTGKPLLSRQFKEISKDSITAYLTNFSGLLLENNSQHTTIESDLIRYIYQPVESFILLVITNLNSNIIQDIDTLQLFSKTISSLLRASSTSATVNDIFLNSFEILNAFDEIITEGYKENLTIGQINTFLEMNSYEEKIQKTIDKNKEMEATEERKRKAKEIQRKELARRAAGNSFAAQAGGNFPSSQPTYSAPAVAEDAEDPTLAYAKAANSYKATSAGRGLQLGKKKGTTGGNSDFTPLLKHEPAAAQQGYAKPVVNQPEIPEVVNNGILISVNEKISAEFLRDGSIKSAELHGDLQLRINNPDLAHSKLILSPVNKKSKLQFRTHPNVDKNQFNNEDVIVLKDSSQSFPSNDKSLQVLRWREIGKGEDTAFLPVVFSIWPTQTDSSINFTIEYELQERLIDEQAVIKNLEILVPDVGSAAYLKSERDDVEFNHVDDALKFVIKELSYEDPSGSIEFTVETTDEDYLFPMFINFLIQDKRANFAGVEVQDVLSVDNAEQSLEYDFVSNVTSENFSII